MTKKLYRSRSDRMLAGVCGGLAEYFGVDPTIVRILFVLFALAGGPGLILYIILMLVIPESSY
jgi:phage shock protein C